MTTYRRADDIDDLVEAVMKKYHKGLHDAGVSWQCLYAYPATDEAGDPTGPALKVNGYPALASIQILSHKRRAAGSADIEITLDWENWSVSSVAEQKALLDHELSHVEPKANSEGAVVRDDGERPVLKLRHHDRQFGWFDRVAHRNGKASVEVRQCREMLDGQQFKQCYLFDLQEAGKS